MAKQCPRCWEKVSPDDEVCPNCGYDFTRRKVQTAESGAETEQKKSVFPTPRRKEEGERTNTVYKIVLIAVLAWAVLSLAGGAYNLYVGNWIQGAGFLISGVIAAVAGMFVYNREHCTLASILVLISGAATFQIFLLIFSLGVSYHVMCCRQFFRD